MLLRADASEPESRHPVVPWWSFTKTVLAAAALRLVDEGRLTLDGLLPDAPCTLRHLLQHTSGLRDYGGVPAYHAAVDAGEPAWPVDTLFERARARELLFAPGAGWAYSNIGYLFVRQLVERATGSDLDRALRDLVFAPLGVEGPFVALTRNQLAAHPWGSQSGYDPGWVYHGLAMGSPDSAALTLRGILGSTFLPPDLRDAMLAGRALDVEAAGRPFVRPACGLGVFIDAASPLGRIVGHTGQGPGSTTAVYAFLDTAPPLCLAAFADDDRQETIGLVEREVLTSAKLKLQSAKEV
jgi:CubicO group peptidase (beta-lactamase class C family)